MARSGGHCDRRTAYISQKQHFSERVLENMSPLTCSVKYGFVGKMFGAHVPSNLETSSSRECIKTPRNPVVKIFSLTQFDCGHTF